MLIISQHARLLNMSFPENTVYRVNAAWFKTRDEFFDLLKKIKNDVFLDFPHGRTKPPVPVLQFGDLLEAMQKFGCIKYFGLSDAKDAAAILKIHSEIPKRIQLIPKIESKEGINNLENIFKTLKRNERYLMLDKEDLYIDLGSHNQLFERYVAKAREKCGKKGFHLLELQGVIFS